MAHRGGYVDPADAARENSLYAFARAVELGYRYLETDVHASADGHLLAFHDKVLDRVSDATGVVAELPFAAIRAARIAGRDQIPTLDEVLESFPETKLNIDIKAPAAVEPLVACLRAHHAHNRVCVSSFSWSRLNRFRRLVGSTVATGMSGPAVGLSAYLSLLARSAPMRGQVYQIPVAQPIKGKKIPVLTAQLLTTAKARDRRVQLWTVNDEEQMHRLIDLGVDGLITDRIDVLRRVATQRGLWAG